MDLHKHHTYGMIGASRWSAGGKGLRLFGSALPGHNAGVTITIKQASVNDHDGMVHVHGEKIVAAVTLSSVQWAEFLTSMNHGDGVPCTIKYVQGDGSFTRGDPPEATSEPERVREGFASLIVGRADKVAAARKELAAKMAGKVSASLAKEIDMVLLTTERDLRSTAPWYVERFAEATDRIVVAAKAEVEAVVSSVATRLGIEAIKMGGIKALLEKGD